MRKHFFFAYNKSFPLEPGIVYVPYVQAQTTEVICGGDFNPKISLRSRYSLTEVNPIYYGDIISSNEQN